MGRFGNLVLLAALAGSAGSLPQRLGGLLKAPPPAEEAGGLQDVENLLNQLAQSRTGAGRGDASLSPEARQILADLTPEVEVIKNPVMDALLRASKSRGSGTLYTAHLAATAHRVYQQNQALLMGVVWGAPAVLLLLSVTAALIGLKGWGRLLAEVCSSLAGKWLFLLSLLGAGAFFSMRIDLWSALPADLWGVPAAALLLSAAWLRWIDMNSPVWNRLLRGLLAPLISCGLILGWDFAAGLVRGVLL